MVRVKRDVDGGDARRSWERQAPEVGLSAETARAGATDGGGPVRGSRPCGGGGGDMRVGPLSESRAAFGDAGLLTAVLAREPGAVTVEGRSGTSCGAGSRRPSATRSRLNEGQKEAVKMILTSKERVVGVQGPVIATL